MEHGACCSEVVSGGRGLRPRCPKRSVEAALGLRQEAEFARGWFHVEHPARPRPRPVVRERIEAHPVPQGDRAGQPISFDPLADSVPLLHTRREGTSPHPYLRCHRLPAPGVTSAALSPSTLHPAGRSAASFPAYGMAPPAWLGSAFCLPAERRGPPSSLTTMPGTKELREGCGYSRIGITT